MNKIIVISIIAIIVILAIVFLSQQAYSRGIGKALISDATNQASTYLATGTNWIMSNVYSKINGEVQNRGEVMQTEANQAKQDLISNLTENIPNKIENYFSGITNSIVHPGTPQNCQPSQTPANQ